MEYYGDLPGYIAYSVASPLFDLYYCAVASVGLRLPLLYGIADVVLLVSLHYVAAVVLFCCCWAMITYRPTSPILFLGGTSVQLSHL